MERAERSRQVKKNNHVNLGQDPRRLALEMPMLVPRAVQEGTPSMTNWVSDSRSKRKRDIFQMQEKRGYSPSEDKFLH